MKRRFSGDGIIGMKVRILKYYVYYIILLSLLFTSCGSNVNSTGFYRDYGVQANDFVMIDIASPNVSTFWSGNASGWSSASSTLATDTPGSVSDIGSFKKRMTIVVGTAVQLSVTARDVAGDSYENVRVTWASDNTSVIAVDRNGKVAVVSAGNATITANFTMPDGTVIADTVLITVVPPPDKDKIWVKNTSTLTRAMWDHASLLWNGYLYVAGGNSDCSGKSDYEDCGVSNKVYYAKVNTDGSTGKFIAGEKMPVHLRGHSLLAHNGFMYIIGGIVQFSPPCIFTDQTCVMPIPDPTTYTHGPDETELNEKVYFAAINPDGTIAAWRETAPLQLPELAPDLQSKAGLFAHSATVVNGYIYVTGGWSVELKKNVNTVLLGRLNPDGSISGWMNQAGFDLPYNLSKHASVSVNVNGDNYLYVIGGNSGEIKGNQVFRNEILFSKIAPDGIPGPWYRALNNLPVPLIDHAAVSSGRYVLVLGGRDGVEECNQGEYGKDQVCTHRYYKFQDVYQYFVNDTGDLELVNNGQPLPSLPLPLFHHAAVADNITGNIYLTGGACGDTGNPINRHNEVYYLTGKKQ